MLHLRSSQAEKTTVLYGNCIDVVVDEYCEGRFKFFLGAYVRVYSWIRNLHSSWDVRYGRINQPQTGNGEVQTDG
jgi:hypothetical protein